MLQDMLVNTISTNAHTEFATLCMNWSARAEISNLQSAVVCHALLIVTVSH